MNRDKLVRILVDNGGIFSPNAVADYIISRKDELMDDHVKLEDVIASVKDWFVNRYYSADPLIDKINDCVSTLKYAHRPHVSITDRDTVLHDYASLLGDKGAKAVAIEEMSELQKEICKTLRGCERSSQLAEEMADVYLILQMLETMLHNRDAVAAQWAKKFERIRKRVERGDPNGESDS